jgi:hypothetical protein
MTPTAAIVAALIWAGAGWAYRYTGERRLQQVREEVRSTAEEIGEITALKKRWESRGLERKLEALRKSLPAERIGSFRLEKRKLTLSLKGLEGRELNRFLSKLGGLPLRIDTLGIRRDGERYGLECRCKW